YLNVHKDLALQRLLVEWDVGKSAHNAELVMSFEIQVRRADEDIVWTVSALKKKLAVPLHWTWDSDLPLECMSHSVRIRSKAEASKTWSQWSLWETIPGPPDTPRDFSCQTRNMREITCTWDQGQDTYLYGSHSSKYKLSEQYVLSFITLSGLQPYTSYTARVRCGAAKHFWRWSEWSKPHSFRTKEKGVSEAGFQANGEIISYEVTWERADRSKPEHISLSSDCNSTRIFIDNHPYRIRIIARNDVGYSHPTVLIIPAATDTEKKLNNSELKEEHVNGTDGGILISWKPRDKSESYIIDWCNYPMLQPCDLQWKRFGPNTSSALIKSGESIIYIFFLMSKYSMLRALSEFRILKFVQYFLFFPAPRFDPDVKKVELSYHEVTLHWDPYPTDEIHPGFLRGYHVYVGLVTLIRNICFILGGSVLCKFTIENPEEKTYTLKHLTANTKYKFAIKAYTGGGETPIINFRYIDTPLDCEYWQWKMFLLTEGWENAGVIFLSQGKTFNSETEICIEIRYFDIGSEKVLKLSDCIPDTLALDNEDEAKKFPPRSLMSSMPIEDKTDDQNPSSFYHNKNEERSLTFTPTPQTHTWFENFAYSSYLAVETNPYETPGTLETVKGELSAVLYQPQYYLNILNDASTSSPGEAAGRMTNLRYISQTDVHCIGRRL
uniref:Leptin receptor n=1 Tax=Coturnix japonica TaxID=93934 RepID=A0A8C2T5K0_COTJA